MSQRNPDIEPVLRHDAEPRERPFVVLTPTYYAGLAVVFAACLTAGLVANVFAFAATFFSLVFGFACAPDLLRAPAFARMDGWARRRAKRRRQRKLRRHAGVDKVFVVVAYIPGVVFCVGLLAVAASPLVAVAGGDWLRTLTGGGATCGISLFIALAVGVGTQMWAQWKGDIPTGPMYFYKATWLANWFEKDRDRLRTIQAVSLLLAVVFALAAAVAEKFLTSEPRQKVSPREHRQQRPEPRDKNEHGSLRREVGAMHQSAEELSSHEPTLPRARL